jgi:hypothetical protein
MHTENLSKMSQCFAIISNLKNLKNLLNLDHLLDLDHLDHLDNQLILDKLLEISSSPSTRHCRTTWILD